MQAATGDASAVFFSQQHTTDTPELPAGETYCQFFANGGGASIAVAVMTGASFDVYLLAVTTLGLEALPGIGDAAFVSPDGELAAGRIHGVGVVVLIQDVTAAGLGDIDARAASIAILEVVVDRV
jgi:hypothetical protein